MNPMTEEEWRWLIEPALMEYASVVIRQHQALVAAVMQLAHSPMVCVPGLETERFAIPDSCFSAD